MGWKDNCKESNEKEREGKILTLFTCYSVICN